MQRHLLFRAAIAVLLIGCSTEYRTGIDDPDASPIDATRDAGTCFVRCGPSLECCAEGTECVADECRPACEGSRCGADDALCCMAGELCVNGGCEMPRGACIDDVDCGSGEYCDLGLDRCLPRPEVECTYVPPEDVFTSELLWAWEEEEVISIPLVVQLTDDQGDGVIDAADVPDVVAIAYDGTWATAGDARIAGGRLVALRGDAGLPAAEREIWRSDDTDFDLCVASSPAAGDLDGDGVTEIVAFATEKEAGGCPAAISADTTVHVVAFDHAGAVVWSTPDPVFASSSTGWTAGGLSVADLDGDGLGEVIAPGVVFEHDGEVRFAAEGFVGAYSGVFPFAADVTDDAGLEVVSARGVWTAGGAEVWSRIEGGAHGFVLGRVIESAPGPQLITISDQHAWVLDAATGETIVGPFEYDADGGSGFVGPPTLADFDGDGRSELGFAGPRDYVVIDFDDGDLSVLWRAAGATGSVGTTVFDFDGNGRAEVVWADLCSLRVLRGTDGESLGGFDNTSITAWESPVIADVSGDGRANLVVVANDDACATATHRGVRVFRSPTDDWIGARPVWNQHAFFYDNVRDDLRLPADPRPSWSSHNTFRLNRFPTPDTVFLAPDLRVVSVDATRAFCPSRVGLRARVQNEGARSVPPGAPVAFYADVGEGPELLGTSATETLVAPGAATWVDLGEVAVPLDAMDTVRVTARADDDGSVPYERGVVNECMEDNNQAEVVLDCGLI